MLFDMDFDGTFGNAEFARDQLVALADGDGIEGYAFPGQAGLVGIFWPAVVAQCVRQQPGQILAEHKFSIGRSDLHHGVRLSDASLRGAGDDACQRRIRGDSVNVSTSCRNARRLNFQGGRDPRTTLQPLPQTTQMRARIGDTCGGQMLVRAWERFSVQMAVPAAPSAPVR